MSNNNERGFTDYGFDKRYHETYDEAYARQSREVADHREMFSGSNQPTSDVTISPGPYVPLGKRRAPAKFAITIGWLSLAACLLVWAGLFEIGQLSVYGYELQSLLFYGGLTFLILGFFAEFLGYLMILFGGYQLIAAFSSSGSSSTEDYVISLFFLLIGGGVYWVFGRRKIE